MKQIISLYSGAGFDVQIILMDMEFNKVIQQIPEVTINMSAHVAEVERHIRVIKEGCWA